MLVPQPLKDPLGGVPLLGRGLPVVPENRFDDREEGPELLLGPGLGLLVARGLGLLEDLL